MIHLPSFTEVLTVSRSRGRLSLDPDGWDGLRGCWSPIQGGGEIYYDVSGYDNNGTLTNMNPPADWIQGENDRVPGYALNLPDATDQIVIANNPSLKIEGKGITLSTWIYPTRNGLSSGSRIISKRTDATGGDVYALYVLASNRVSFRLNNVDSQSVSAATLNEWVYFVATYDGSQKRIYWNGVLDDTDGETDAINGSSRAVHFGVREGEADRDFQGRLGPICIYDRGLTAARVQKLYSRPLDMFTLRRRTPVGVEVAPPAVNRRRRMMLFGAGV